MRRFGFQEAKTFLLEGLLADAAIQMPLLIAARAASSLSRLRFG
jgi:hypothetical protein